MIFSVLSKIFRRKTCEIQPYRVDRKSLNVAKGFVDSEGYKAQTRAFRLLKSVVYAGFFFGFVAFCELRSTLISSVNSLANVIPTKDQLNELKTANEAEFNDLKTTIKDQLDELETANQAQFNDLKTAIKDQLNEVKTAIKDQLDELETANQAQFDEIKNTLKATAEEGKKTTP